jgi:glutamyl/glutaminyl-tRNA synthetase
MALLGWNPGGDKEFMTIDEMINIFELKDINSASPVFDVNKLEWMNGEYIRMMDNQKFKKLLLEFYSQDTNVTEYLKSDSKTLDVILELAKTRMKTFGEFRDLVLPKMPELSKEEKDIAATLLEKFSAIKNWDKATVLSAMKETLVARKAKGSILYKITTGFEKGLPLPDSLEILGKEEALERVKKALG